MKLGGRRAGHVTLFIDATSNDIVLKIQVDDSGGAQVAYKLFDVEGQLVEESGEPRIFPEGVCVKSSADELLLNIPAAPEDAISYRLYGSTGQLLTFSDGLRTQIFPSLRMDGKSVGPARAKQGV